MLSKSSANPARAGWLRISLDAPPIDLLHRCSPRFMSVAVTKLYGGLRMGSPCGPAMPAVGARTQSQFVLARSGARSEATIAVLRIGTNMVLVSGSTAPPFQLAPPP